MPRRKYTPEPLLRAEVRRLDVLIGKARAIYAATNNSNAQVGAIRTEAELTKIRRGVCLALASLQADDSATVMKCLRASAAADRSFAAASDLHQQELRATGEVDDGVVDLEVAYASLDLPTRRWLQRRLDDDLARSTG